MTGRRDRCMAKHREDRRPCDGRIDAVVVRDRVGGSATGCVLHAAALLAALGKAGRVELHRGAANAAMRSYQLAATEPTDDFLTIRGALAHRRKRPPDGVALLTPAETATALRVVPETVARWARAGKLRFIRTAGGQRRYHRADVEARLADAEAPRDSAGTVPAAKEETT